MLIEEVFDLTTQLSCAVLQKSRQDRTKDITREYIERVADGDEAIKHHIARELIVNRVFFDV